MKTSLLLSGAAALAVLSGGILVACGGGTAAPGGPKSVGAKDQSKWPADDHSMCEWRNNPEVEVSETAGPGAIRPNVRRVFKDIGDGENRHKVLICREIDTNLDGIKDVMRSFNAKGEAQKENSDTNYDGKVDLWTIFAAGRIQEEDVDSNFDGAPDVWKFYVEGKLSRIKRDRNFDGKPDIWEIYSNGILERMGIDDTFDGHVDRWDRDESVRALEDQQAAAAASADAGAAKDAGSK